MLYLFTVSSLVLCFVRKIYSVPPDACFAKFRWEDCGKPPTPVMYYWKSGSRCEVGLWRGCLPNNNMFKDEYECVATCIFSPRARPEDYHNYNEIEPQPDYANIETTTLTDSTDNDTASSDSEVTTADDGNTEAVEIETTSNTNETGETTEETVGNASEETVGNATEAKVGNNSAEATTTEATTTEATTSEATTTEAQ